MKANFSCPVARACAHLSACTSAGRFATFTAIRRASSNVSTFAMSAAPLVSWSEALRDRLRNCCKRLVGQHQLGNDSVRFAVQRKSLIGRCKQKPMAWANAFNADDKRTERLLNHCRFDDVSIDELETWSHSCGLGRR